MPEPNEVRDTITLMVMQGPTGSIRRIHLRRSWLRKAASGAAVAVCVMLGMSVDYVRVRVQLGELDDLRSETGEQRAQIRQAPLRERFVHEEPVEAVERDDRDLPAILAPGRRHRLARRARGRATRAEPCERGSQDDHDRQDRREGRARPARHA